MALTPIATARHRVANALQIARGRLELGDDGDCLPDFLAIDRLLQSALEALDALIREAHERPPS